MTKEHSHAQVLRWIADGKTVQFDMQDHEGWQACSDYYLLNAVRNSADVARFRIAPRTIKVGSREINAPPDVQPEDRAAYWTVDSDGEVLKDCWTNHTLDRGRLEQGNVWATEADATAARDAWRELMKGQV